LEENRLLLKQQKLQQSEMQAMAHALKKDALQHKSNVKKAAEGEKQRMLALKQVRDNIALAREQRLFEEKEKKKYEEQLFWRLLHEKQQALIAQGFSPQAIAALNVDKTLHQQQHQHLQQHLQQTECNSPSHSSLSVQEMHEMTPNVQGRFVQSNEAAVGGDHTQSTQSSLTSSSELYQHANFSGLTTSVRKTDQEVTKSTRVASMAAMQAAAAATSIAAAAAAAAASLTFSSPGNSVLHVKNAPTPIPLQSEFSFSHPAVVVTASDSKSTSVLAPLSQSSLSQDRSTQQHSQEQISISTLPQHAQNGAVDECEDAYDMG
jgi:hypothetical protein